MIGKRIRRMNRYRDIALVLTRHGFGFIVREMDIFQMLSLPAKASRNNRKTETNSIGVRIRHAIQELGPTFIKLGQFASTRADIIPEAIINELEKLQDQVEPIPFGQVHANIESGLDVEIKDVFTSIEETPLAAASIGQVHVGVLKSGERVAVKVQRPDITETIHTDLDILRNLAALAETRFEWAKRYQLQKMIEEFGKALLEELDYTIEGRNTEAIAKQFKQDAHVRIPHVYWEYTTKKLLTIEFLEGIKLNHPEQLQFQGYRAKIIAERLVKAVFHQIFMEGFFHADPHPGNLMALPGETIAFLDFGMVGRLTAEMKRHLSGLIIALMRKSTEGVIRALLGMGLITEEVDRHLLRRDVDRLRDKYMEVPLSEISLGSAVNDLFDVAFRHRIRIPADFILLGKTLLIVEGVVKHLDPDISIVKIAEPFGRQLLKERLHPKRLAEHAKEMLSAYGEILIDLPQHLKDLLTLAKKGRLEVSLPQIYLFLRKMDRIGNRLSFSIVLLAFSIIMSGLIIGSSLNRQPSLPWSVPTLEFGSLIAVLMFIWLIHSILKNGRF